MDGAILFVGGCSALLAYNALFPAKRSSLLAGPSAAAGFITGELALQGIVFLPFLFAGCLALARPHGTAGWLGLALLLLGWLGLCACALIASRAGAVLDAALDQALPKDAALAPAAAAQLAGTRSPEAWRLIFPFFFAHPEVERIDDIAYAAGGVRNQLDLYRSREARARAPVVLQIHGGSWLIGHKRQQAMPLMVDLAARGFVCVAANYRLSPRATFPEHLIDVKRALIWIKRNVAAYGGDPECVIVTGGSAGGHLAALLALTPNRPEFQPGDEDVDTRVQACIPFYGVYDLAGTPEHPPPRGLLSLWEKQVLKQPLSEARSMFEAASPIAQVSADAPPFFVLHGTHDSIVSVKGARRFAAALRAVSRAPVVYAELPGAQHAFDVFHSPRTHHAIRAIHRFLAYVLTTQAARG